MAEESVDLRTGRFGVKLTGPNALIMLLILMLMGNGILYLWEGHLREHEHHQIMCSIKLNLFIYTNPKGEPIQWEKMPTDLYECIPKFFYERPLR